MLARSGVWPRPLRPHIQFVVNKDKLAEQAAPSVLAGIKAAQAKGQSTLLHCVQGLEHLTISVCVASITNQ
jgi:hypothetical protein